jgi:hypothetical protein
MEMELEESGPSSEELAFLDHEVQNVTKRLKLSPAEQMPLFVELQAHILLGDDPHQQPYVAKNDTRGNELLAILVSANIGLAKYWVSRARPNALFDDYLQEALMGLRKGVLRFDPTRNVQPSSYITYWVRQAFRGVDDSLRTIYIPSKARKDALRNGVKLPVVYSYDAMVANYASDGELSVDELRFMADADQVAPDQAVDAREGFHHWVAMLRRDLPGVLKRHGEVDVLLFSMRTGLWRYPEAPMSIKDVAKENDMAKTSVRQRIETVTRSFAHRYGLKRRQLEPILEALVEYSLHAGIPT